MGARSKNSVLKKWLTILAAPKAKDPSGFLLSDTSLEISEYSTTPYFPLRRQTTPTGSSGAAFPTTLTPQSVLLDTQ